MKLFHVIMQTTRHVGPMCVSSKVIVTTFGGLALVKGVVGFGVAMLHGMQLLVIHSTVMSVFVVGQMILFAVGVKYRSSIDANLGNHKLVQFDNV